MGFLVVSKQGKIEWANREAERIFGYGNATLPGVSIEELVAQDARDRHPQMRESYSRSPGLRPMGHGRDLRGRRRDGSEFPAEVSLSPMDDGAVGVVVVDISQRTELQLELQRARKLESLGVLCGGVAHDFNNILTSLLGYLDLAKDAQSPERLQFALEQSEEIAEKARTLISQLLTFRPQKFEDPAEPLNLCKSLEDSIQLLSAELPSNISVEVILENAGQLRLDPTKLHRLISNLWYNAVAAMGESEGNLTITLKAKPPGALLTVSDTGVGIPQDQLDRIFDPFFTTKDVGEGTGLGLSVVHGIVNSVGGEIQVKSRPRQGTSFLINFKETVT